MPPNLVKSSGSNKLLQCTLCSKKFSRTDHLKRHQLRHTGVKPYSCIFCSDGFTRSDNLRDHYPNCPQRQNRPIPEAARGGRRSHACDSCTAMKLGCDGKNPCNTCRQKKIVCKYVRLQSKGLHVRANSHDGDSHRGSINFLLNAGGSANFIDCFRFPATAERRDIYNYRNQQPCSDLIDQYSGSESGSFDNDPINWPSIDNTHLLNFMSSPFSSFPSEISPTSQMALRDWEPQSIQSSTIIQCIRERALMIPMNSQQQSEVDQHLNFIFTPSKFTRFVHDAFEQWHPNCPILHIPSFSIETAPLPLLTVITVMGALYSKNDAEVNSARSILDLVEYYIFSLDDLTDEHEIRQMMQSGNIIESVFSLPNLQAAYIMVVLQFWTGSTISRKRAIESRFCNVVKIARRLRLLQASHDQEDLISEAIWIEKECQIRLINAMYLFDCALSFFSHFPCRLTLPEMEFDLTCEDRLFFSHHPFSEPNFLLSRNLTTFDAFQSLFIKIPARPDVNTVDENPLGLNATDMFTLIHLLFVYVQTQMVMFTPPFRLVPPETQMSQNLPVTTPSSDSNISIMKAALARWHSIWINISVNVRPDGAADQSLLHKNALNYLMITQLILMNPSSAEILMHMEVGCDDALSQLRGFANGNSIHAG
ncbi:C2H2 finger domain protein [Golovinomyces cichoracearum]|uniref:C2H2 finger domain protein n=1 Tax=Golovinomyces cichoracearum TaxID=62708 RepID=A0A420HHZ9_9PEZI|nr:C2H2 finger domain protein [Golovinomyces cichoracearum]